MPPLLFRIESGGLYFYVLGPLAVVLVFVLLMIPSLLTPGARPSGIGKAIYCYLMQAIGVFLMSVGGLPAVLGVVQKMILPGERYTTETYLALLLIFACGGLTFLWHEQAAEELDDASSRVSAIVFWYLFKTIGFLMTLGAGLSLILVMLLGERPLDPEWWMLSSVFFLYGLLLCWCTKNPEDEIRGFDSLPMVAKLKKNVKIFGRKKSR